MKHCIVTPDIIGPIKNGGIGTHCHWFARALAESGRDVSILFTGPMVHGSEAEWKGFYQKLGIKFFRLQSETTRSYSVRAFELQQRSYDVYRFLLRHSFDLIHFQDWQANGLQTIQAKRTLGEFEATCITVTLHSNTRWIAEGGRHWYRQPVHDAMTNWAEAFVARHADMVFAPSEYMLKWVEAKGWLLPENRKVIPVCSEDLRRDAGSVAAEPGVLAFFGRLEARKGLDLFLKALRQLPASQRSRLRKVHFIGKIGRLGNLASDEVIRKTMKELALSYEIHPGLDSRKALDLLLTLKASVFVPSLQDNYPLTVVETASVGLPVYAAKVGGIPEIVGPAHLFDPSVASLREKLEAVIDGQSLVANVFYDPARSRQVWLDTMAECEQAPTTRADEAATGSPLISICVPYYNYPDYLPKLLDSLRRSDYKNFEVIVIDDGSPDPRAREVFDRLAETTADITVHFSRHKNAGVGATRNAAASLANGEYLVFMDADNLAKTDMLSTFLAAMQRASADIVTCYFDAFEEHREPVGENDIHHVYAPAGPALEVGWSENVFGDANFCIRKSVFDELGGFGTERESSWEDWDFLVRARFAGKSIDVIPKSLFWYRYTDMGFSRNTDPYLNQRRLLGAYVSAADPLLSPVIEVMYQTALSGRGKRTPAGEIAGDLADRIYTKFGSPSGPIAQALEKFFKRFTT